MSTEEILPELKNFMFDTFIASARASDRVIEFETKVREFVKSPEFKNRRHLHDDYYEVIDPKSGESFQVKYRVYDSLALDCGGEEVDDDELEETLDEILGYTWYSFVRNDQPDIIYFGPVEDEDLIDIRDVQSANLLKDKFEVDIINTPIGIIYDPKELILFPVKEV